MTNIAGYAFTDNWQEKAEANSKRYLEVRDSGAVFELKKSPQYGHTKFHGYVECNGAALDERDIALFADSGNLCFGGCCTITRRDGDRIYFEGSYNVD